MTEVKPKEVGGGPYEEIVIKYTDIIDLGTFLIFSALIVFALEHLYR